MKLQFDFADIVLPPAQTNKNEVETSVSYNIRNCNFHSTTGSFILFPC